MSGVSVQSLDAEGRMWRVEASSPAELDPAGERLQGGRGGDSGGLRNCLACGHPELYTQRDFPRWLGITVVVAAAVLAPFTWYLSLAVAALVDALLYLAGPSVVVCYVCGAHHRGFPLEPSHPRYDLGIAERLRHGDKAVMGTPMRSGGTAGAPEPEH